MGKLHPPDAGPSEQVLTGPWADQPSGVRTGGNDLPSQNPCVVNFPGFRPLPEESGRGWKAWPEA